MSITRTIELADPTPEEMAEMFCFMTDTDQARFFGEVGRIANGWPGAGLCQQSYAIVQCLDSDGRQAIETLAAHLSAEDA